MRRIRVISRAVPAKGQETEYDILNFLIDLFDFLSPLLPYKDPQDQIVPGDDTTTA